jgi:hypothetical protein
MRFCDGWDEWNNYNLWTAGPGSPASPFLACWGKEALACDGVSSIYRLLKVSGFFLAAGGVFFSGIVSSMMIFFTPSSVTT